MVDVRGTAESQPELQCPYDSIGVIGANGQIGRFLLNELSQYSQLPLNGCVHKPEDIEPLVSDYPRLADRLTVDVAEFVEGNPTAIFVAVPNTEVEGILREIDGFVSRPTTVVLVQNGIVSATELSAIQNPNITLMRASIFTAVSKDTPLGDVIYDRTKRRIAFAPISVGLDEDTETLESQRQEELFRRLGFETARFGNHRDLEWTKLLLNTIGTTAVVTGMTPEDTFRDPDLFHKECQALAQRLSIMKAAGINTVDLPWINTKQLRVLAGLAHLGTHVPSLVRNKIAKKFAKERDNKPPAAARRIEQGLPPSEAPSYHQPFVDVASEFGLDASVDETILKVLRDHLNPSTTLNLSAMNHDARRELLLSQVS